MTHCLPSCAKVLKMFLFLSFGKLMGQSSLFRHIQSGHQDLRSDIKQTVGEHTFSFRTSVLTVATKVKKKIKMLGLWFRNEMYLCQSSFQIWCLSLKECHWHGMNLHNVNVSWVNTYNADYGTCSIKLPTHCWRLWSAAAHPNLSLGINHFG